MSFFFKLSLFLTIPFMLFAYENSYAQASSPHDILYEVMKNTENINTLSTNFLQEKKVDFLKNTIKSSGFLYFAKEDNNSYSLLWEYNPPSASGMWFNNATAWIWTQNRANLRKAEGHEGRFMNTMKKQMLFWLKINPQEIERLYTLEALTKYTIKLKPKYKDVFKSITVTFSDDLRSLKGLILEENQGNYTTLSFFETEYNCPIMNSFPDGTAMP